MQPELHPPAMVDWGRICRSVNEMEGLNNSLKPHVAPELGLGVTTSVDIFEGFKINDVVVNLQAILMSVSDGSGLVNGRAGICQVIRRNRRSPTCGSP
ncbi:MAG: hypothetical protein MJH10_16610, partial [Epibacterium sp.]|nr:hypothetical protein [Epibacterium sp.]